MKDDVMQEFRAHINRHAILTITLSLMWTFVYTLWILAHVIEGVWYIALPAYIFVLYLIYYLFIQKSYYYFTKECSRIIINGVIADSYLQLTNVSMTVLGKKIQDEIKIQILVDDILNLEIQEVPRTISRFDNDARNYSFFQNLANKAKWNEVAVINVRQKKGKPLQYALVKEVTEDYQQLVQYIANHVNKKQ